MGETVLYEGHSLFEDALRIPTVFLGALGELFGLGNAELVENSAKDKITNGWYDAKIRISNVELPKRKLPSLPSEEKPKYPEATSLLTNSYWLMDASKKIARYGGMYDRLGEIYLSYDDAIEKMLENVSEEDKRLFEKYKAKNPLFAILT